MTNIAFGFFDVDFKYSHKNDFFFSATISVYVGSRFTRLTCLYLLFFFVVYHYIHHP